MLNPKSHCLKDDATYLILWDSKGSTINGLKPFGSCTRNTGVAPVARNKWQLGVEIVQLRQGRASLNKWWIKSYLSEARDMNLSLSLRRFKRHQFLNNYQKLHITSLELMGVSDCMEFGWILDSWDIGCKIWWSEKIFMWLFMIVKRI